MKILVTGAAGLIGGGVIRELLECGDEVRAYDVRPVAEALRPQVEMVYGDILDGIALMRACDGCESVIHLAALQVSMKNDERVFHTNVVGAQRLLAAAEAVGVRRVALASSNCANGLVYAEPHRLPKYLPIDVEHPLAPHDYYSLSKQINENTAAAFAARGDMTVVCLRPSSVKQLGLAAQARWHAWYLENRKDLDYNDFWAYIDLRDAARCFRAAVTRPLEGFHIIHISAHDSFTRHDIRALVRHAMPTLAEYADNLEPNQSLYDTKPMAQLLGIATTKSWRDVPELAQAAREEEPAS